MKKISYSKDVDALLIEISNDAIAYAEEDGQVILHYSPDDKLVLVEILDFRRFMSKSVFEKLSEAFKEDLNHADIEKSLRSFR